MALPPDERERLASRLMHSLEENRLSEVDEVWLKLAEERFAQYKAGKREGISGDRIFSDIRKELGRRG